MHLSFATDGTVELTTEKQRIVKPTVWAHYLIGLVRSFCFFDRRIITNEENCNYYGK